MGFISNQWLTSSQRRASYSPVDTRINFTFKEYLDNEWYTDHEVALVISATRESGDRQTVSLTDDEVKKMVLNLLIQDEGLRLATIAMGQLSEKRFLEMLEGAFSNREKLKLAAAKMEQEMAK